MYVFKLVGILVWIQLSVEFLVSDNCNTEEPGYFRYTVKNLIHQPLFTLSVNVSLVGCDPKMHVVRYMETVCDLHKQVFSNFSQTYFSGIGYYVSALNGLEEIVGETYWEFIEHENGTQFPIAASSYIPKPGDHIGWNLTEINPFFVNSTSNRR